MVLNPPTGWDATKLPCSLWEQPLKTVLWSPAALLLFLPQSSQRKLHRTELNKTNNSSASRNSTDEPPRLAEEQTPTLQKLRVLSGHLKISTVESYFPLPAHFSQKGR